MIFITFSPLVIIQKIASSIFARLGGNKMFTARVAVVDPLKFYSCLRRLTVNTMGLPSAVCADRQ